MSNSDSDPAEAKPQQDAAFSLEEAVDRALRQARRLVVAVVGGTVVLAGIVMLVTPGPAMVLIPAGLGILAIEFTWARRLLRRVRHEMKERMGRRSTDDCDSQDRNNEGSTGLVHQSVDAHSQN